MGVLKDEKPLFIIILKGSFILRLISKALDFDVELCFMQLKSYNGTQSSGKIKTLWEFPNKLKDEH